MGKKFPLHVQIMMALVLGLVYGVIAVQMGWVGFTENWINPWGTIFVKLLKLIAVPLVVASLITGVASLSDLRKLSRIGGKNHCTLYDDHSHRSFYWCHRGQCD
jgi:proton glutamate symport protein